METILSVFLSPSLELWHLGWHIAPINSGAFAEAPKSDLDVQWIGVSGRPDILEIDHRKLFYFGHVSGLCYPNVLIV